MGSSNLDRELVLALAGNPNCGKSTIFNALTGARQHVGNYPGITVEKKDGEAHLDGKAVKIIDLPGTYSLTAYSLEERVARRVILEDGPNAVIDIADAGTLERHLYLAVQFLEMGMPFVLCLNMMDEARKKGIEINLEELSKRLDVPVVSTVGRTGKGIHELLEIGCRIAEEHRGKPWQPRELSYGPDLDPVLCRMTELVAERHFLDSVFPARWIALKYLENDAEIIRIGSEHDKKTSDELTAMVQEVTQHLSDTLETYPEAIISDYRYGYISALLRDGVISKPVDARQRTALSEKIDKVLTQRFLGPLIMLVIMYLMYQLTFAVGEIPMEWLESFFGWLAETAETALPEGVFRSLIVSGIIEGIGGLLGFVPLIVVVFICIAILDDSGYMARIAYMLDRIFHFFGLHGLSVMPFIISGGIAGGCAVPGIMASRTLRSPKERLATILTAPFFSCGAKLPVFLLISAVFFPERGPLVMFLLTVAGWIFALLVARLLRSTLIAGEGTPFVMELPPYRLPTLKGVLIHTWERTWAYIKKAGTVVLAITIVIWAAMTYPRLPDAEAEKYGTEEEAQAAALRYSIAGRIGTGLEAVTRYAGFDWRSNIALIGGFGAKEVIVSTLGTAFSLSGDVDEENESLIQRIKDDPHWRNNLPAALAFLLFVLLYAPCFMAVVAIAREAGSWKWAAFSIVFNTLFAYAVAVGVYQIGRML